MAIPDITEATKGAKILVFVIPHQFIHKICDAMKPHVTEGTIGISLIKVGPRDLLNFLDYKKGEADNFVTFLLRLEVLS